MFIYMGNDGIYDCDENPPVVSLLSEVAEEHGPHQGNATHKHCSGHRGHQREVNRLRGEIHATAQCLHQNKMIVCVV